MSTSAKITGLCRPGIFFYLMHFPNMQNWNIVSNTNVSHIMKVHQNISINKVYIKKSFYIKPCMHICRFV